MLDDEKLLQLLQHQPEQGLLKLMEQYMGLVYAIVAGKLAAAGHEDIEETVSDVFYEFYEKRQAVDLSKGSLAACLAVTAKRRAIDRHRRVSRGADAKLSLAQVEQLPAMPMDSPQEAVIRREQKALLLREIAALGRPDSEIFIRRYYLGQSSKTIAAALRLRTNTVDKKISRGLAKLRQALGGER